MVKYNPYQNIDKLVQEVVDLFETDSTDSKQQSVSIGTVFILLQIVGRDWKKLNVIFPDHYILGYVFGFSFGMVSEFGAEGDHEKITLVNKIYKNIFEYLFDDDNPNPIALRRFYEINEGVRFDLHDGEVEWHESYLICQDLHIQGDALFREGADSGAFDVENFFVMKKDPVGLIKYLKKCENSPKSRLIEELEKRSGEEKCKQVFDEQVKEAKSGFRFICEILLGAGICFLILVGIMVLFSK